MGNCCKPAPLPEVPEVDIPPPKAGSIYADWSRTVTFVPEKVLCPANADEIVKILQEQDEDKTMSIIASGHSCSRIYKNKTVITLDFMTGNTIEDISTSGEDVFSVVKVPAQMTLRKMLVELGKHGRSIPATGGTDEQQLGGVIATNTAPATKERTIYSGVVSIDYVTKEGVKTVSGEGLNAFICNVGILGVIISVTIQTIPDEGFRAIQRIRKVDDLLQIIVNGNNYINNEEGDDTEEYQFWRFNWLQKSNDALLWAARTVDTVEDRNYRADGDYVKEYRQPLDMDIYQRLADISSGGKPFYNDVIKVTFDAMKILYQKNPNGNTFYGPLRNMIPVDRFANEDVFCVMAEWAFHPKEAFTIKKLYEEYFEEHEWPNLPVEVEYVKSDEYYMSPWNSKGILHEGKRTSFLIKFNTMWYALRSERMEPEFRSEIEEHAKGLWNKLKENGIAFKAHWGKVNFTTPDDVRNYYEWDKFKPFIQDQFVNNYMNERLPMMS